MKTHLVRISLVFMFFVAVLLPLLLVGCAGTNVGQKSVTRAVIPGTEKVYKANVEKTYGSADALFSKLDSGALNTYVEVDENGYIVDLSGQTLGADATAVAKDLVSLTNAIAKFLPAGQIAELADMIDAGEAGTDIGEQLANFLNGSE